MKDGAASLLTAALLLALIAVPLAVFTLLGGVQFALPLGFALAAAAVPLLLLYMLKARRPRRTVASLIFWAPIARQQQAGTPFARLRRNLVLVLQLLALAALVYGLARPVVQAHIREGASLVLILDTSASMLARDHQGGTRFDAARAAALERIRSMGPRDEATLIAADRTARTVVPWTPDEASLERGLYELSARHTGTVLGEALLLASSSAGAATGKVHVHLFSDGGGPAPPPVTLGGPLSYHSFGTTGENVGIVSIEARPRIGAGEVSGDLPYEVFAGIRNAGRTPRRVYIGLQRAGDVLAARRLEIPANAQRPVVLEARLAPGPVSVCLLPENRVDSLDALPIDDLAYALIPEALGVPVGLVTASPSPALERALAAAGARLTHMTPATYREDPQLRLYVFEGSIPQRLPPRDCLLIAPPRGVGPIELAPPAENLTPAAWDRDEPLLRYVELRDVDVTEARPLLLGGGARVLVQCEDGAGAPAVLMAAWEEGSSRRIVVGFDLYHSTWPLRASFPIFARNLLEAAGERDRLAQGGLAAGVPLPIPVGSSESEIVVESPDGQLERVAAWGGQAYFAATGLTGVYTARAGDREERFCVNIGDPQETHIEPRARFELEGQSSAPAPETGRPAEVARWFAMIALILLAIEFWVYHRRLD